MKHATLLIALLIQCSLFAQEDSLVLYLGKTAPGGVYNQGDIVLHVHKVGSQSTTKYSIKGHHLSVPQQTIRGPQRYFVTPGHEFYQREIASIQRLESGAEIRVSAVIMGSDHSRHYVTATYKIP